MKLAATFVVGLVLGALLPIWMMVLAALVVGISYAFIVGRSHAHA